MAVSGAALVPPTATGNRALMLEEPLIFEIGSPDRTGVREPERVAAIPPELAFPPFRRARTGQSR